MLCRRVAAVPGSLLCVARADGAGTIDASEFAEMCHHLDPAMGEREIARALGEVDKDGDGEIDRNKFEAWWQANNTA